MCFDIFTNRPEYNTPGVGLDDEVVCTCGLSDSYSDVDLPLGRSIQVGDNEDLLLLVMQCVERAEASIVGIVFDPAAHYAREVITHLGTRRKAQPLLHIGCKVRSSAGLTAKYHRPTVLSMMGLISHVQVSGE